MSRTTLIVAGLTLLALALRLVLVRDSLLGDELIMFGIVHDRPLGDTLHVIRETEKTPPLHFLLAWAAARLGDPTLTIRLPSLLAGVALVPAVFLLGRETVSRRAGLIAAAIAALQPFAIFYATEARAYALIAFFVVASTLCLLRALDTGRVSWWAAYAVAVLAAAYTHYIAAFALAAQGGRERRAAPRTARRTGPARSRAGSSPATGERAARCGSPRRPRGCAAPGTTAATPGSRAGSRRAR